MRRSECPGLQGLVGRGCGSREDNVDYFPSHKIEWYTLQPFVISVPQRGTSAWFRARATVSVPCAESRDGHIELEWK